MTVGSWLGPYEVLAPIGVGGMGEVYRARDSRLGREVAIKVLPPDRVADEGRRRRFAQEARAASALNHPHIVTIHEIECVDGVDFIVMEYVPGRPLEALISKVGMPVGEALRVAIVVAEALAQAHAHGIVHRDLTPANIVVGAQGVVKVLDFGLAKLMGEDEGDGRATRGDGEGPAAGTHPGAGTAGYMSPEQAEGRPVDARSDVFSFGAVLYEMVTGRRAFRGTSRSETLAAVAHDEPRPATEVVPGTAASLGRLIQRCLRKEPDRRYQHMLDVKLELLEIVGELAARTPAIPRTGARMVAAAAAVGIASLIAWTMWPRAVPRVTRMASVARGVRFPPFPSEFALRSDGTRIYFPEFVNGRLRARVMAAAGGPSIPLDFGISENEVVDAVSPDGAELLVAAFGGGGKREIPVREASYFVVPAVGGTPRRLGEVVGHASEWLPDGRILLAKGSDLSVVERDGSRGRILATVPGRLYWPRLSPEGRRVRFTVALTNTEQIWEVNMDGTAAHPILPQWNTAGRTCCGVWAGDGRDYVFQATRGEQAHLWALRDGWRWWPVRASEPVQLTDGSVQFRRPLASREGSRIFALGWHLQGEVARLDVSTGRWEPPVAGLSAEHVVYSRDGGWMAYVTYPDGELWRARSDGTERLRLCALRYVGEPAWSPDGGRLAFGAGATDPQHVFIVDRDGGGLRDLGPGWGGAWPPDGRSVLIEDTRGLEIRDLEGHAVAQVPAPTAFLGPQGFVVGTRWSPDGRHLLAHTIQGMPRLLLYDFATKTWSELVRRWLAFPTWSRDGTAIYFRGDSIPGYPEGVFRLRVADRRVERVAALDVPMIWGSSTFWMGLGPGDSPLVLRDLTIYEIHALDLGPS